jgi:anti-anti-sigma regulatory factor
VGLSIEKTRTARGVRLALSGVIDEGADFDTLADLTGSVEINMSGVKRINSFGARAWMDAVRVAAKKASLSFVECPPPVIDQLNMIQGFLGHSPVRNFFAPMICDNCEGEAMHLFDVRACKDRDGHLTPVQCDDCGGRMSIDDLEEQYTLFLREPTMVG